MPTRQPSDTSALRISDNRRPFWFRGGLEYRLDKHWSLQTYLLLNRDSFDTRGNSLEIRPVFGITAKTQISDNVEIGAWLRYEARMLDVGGDKSRFQNRLRLQPYVDVKFSGALDDWHGKVEIEPRYVFWAGDDYFNGLRARASVGYQISDTLSLDFRYSREYSRASRGSDLNPSTDTFTVHFVKLLGVGKKGPATTQIDD